MLVVDASVLVAFVLDDGPVGARARARFHDAHLYAPEFALVEATSALRRITLTTECTPDRAQLAMHDLLDMPMILVPSAPLLRRAWAFRNNLSIYDGCYVALAEDLDAPLLTLDVRLAGSPGLACRVEHLSPLLRRDDP